ncbi:MAG: hypothetical protein Q9179_005885, partial [Wetmoreana sp. 5 TL-2023]
EAKYYNVITEGEGKGNVVKDAAWYYPDPVTERAEGLRGWVAFYKGKIDVQAE